MSEVVTFAAGDKDYIDKLNQMSQNSGDTAQLKADTAQIKSETAQIKSDTQAIKDQTLQLKTDVEGIKAATQSIATGDLIWDEITANQEVKHGDMLLVQVADVELSIINFKAALAVGHWFSVTNESDGVVWVKSLADLSLIGEKKTLSSGDRFGISPGKTYTFRAKSLTDLRIS